MILQDAVSISVCMQAVDLHDEILKTRCAMAVCGHFQCRVPQCPEDDARPYNSAESLNDDVLEAHLQVQLAEVHKLSKTQFAISLRQWVLCTGIHQADDQISVRARHQYWETSLALPLPQRASWTQGAHAHWCTTHCAGPHTVL